MNIFVGGINGVGKSTILKEVAQTTGYRYIHMTSHLMNHLGVGSDYEKLRSLTQAQRDAGLAECIQKLIATSNSTGEIYIYDIHYLNLVRGNISVVTGPWLDRFDAFVLVTSPIQDILERVRGDHVKRDRALFQNGKNETDNEKEFTAYSEQTRKEFLGIVEKYHRPSLEIINKKNKKDEAVKKLIEFITQLKSSYP